MSSDSDSDDGGAYAPYAGRAEWSDVTPVGEMQGDDVVRIAYTDRFRDCFAYFTAVLKTDEMSGRALSLTLEAATLNPANYTVWQQRRRLLKALAKDPAEELPVVSDFIRKNMKNYQVWHHRQAIVEQLPVTPELPQSELSFISEMLKLDNKNYHAWQYRQWVVKRFDAFDSELDYVNELIATDCRNNSAWNHRYFVLNSTGALADEAVVSREVLLTCEVARKTPHNESAWNFLRGVLLEGKLGNVKDFCEALYESGCRSSHLLHFLIDIGREEMAASGDDDRGGVMKRCLDLCSLLATEHDVIRKNYWNFLAKSLKERFPTLCVGA